MNSSIEYTFELCGTPTEGGKAGDKTRMDCQPNYCSVSFTCGTRTLDPGSCTALGASSMRSMTSLEYSNPNGSGEMETLVSIACMEMFSRVSSLCNTLLSIPLCMMESGEMGARGSNSSSSGSGDTERHSIDCSVLNCGEAGVSNVRRFGE